jgi:hypothetical protein
MREEAPDIVWAFTDEELSDSIHQARQAVMMAERLGMREGDNAHDHLMEDLRVLLTERRFREDNGWGMVVAG